MDGFLGTQTGSNVKLYCLSFSASGRAYEPLPSDQGAAVLGGDFLPHPEHSCPVGYALLLLSQQYTSRTRYSEQR